MEAILLGIYSFIVWLVFFKFKLLPWNTPWKVTVVIIPVVGMATLILLLNVFAPSSADVRVYKYTVPVVSQVKGRVLEVPVEEGNRLVKKGDVLFKIDPQPYKLAVAQLEAQLASAVAAERELQEQGKGARGGVDQSAARLREVMAKVDLARTRVAQNRELVAKGAGNRFDLEQAETNLREMESTLDGARSAEAQSRSAEGQALAAERQIRQRMGAKSNGEWAQVAQTRAQLENAKWELSQTVALAPSNGTPTNVQLRPGAFAVPLPAMPALTFVEDEFQVVAFFHQNELHQVATGDEAEIFLRTLPGEIIKAKVDSIVWAQGQGTQAAMNTVPQTGLAAPIGDRFPVKLTIDPKYREVFLAAGAQGDAAIYTQHMGFLHILRKVLLRVSTKMNYLILKLH